MNGLIDQLYPDGMKESVAAKGNSLRIERLSAAAEGEKKGSWERKRRLLKSGVAIKKFG